MRLTLLDGLDGHAHFSRSSCVLRVEATSETATPAAALCCQAGVRQKEAVPLAPAAGPEDTGCLSCWRHLLGALSQPSSCDPAILTNDHQHDVSAPPPLLLSSSLCHSQCGVTAHSIRAESLQDTSLWRLLPVSPLPASPALQRRWAATPRPDYAPPFVAPCCAVRNAARFRSPITVPSS